MTSGDRPAGEATGADVRTFLIADVRGYTRFTHEQGDEAAAELAAGFASLARRGIEAHGGELLELRGDEALGVFTSAREAVRASVDLQRLFRGGDEEQPGLPLGVGIGLDAGEAVPVEGGYRGGALNLAARLCSLASPGEILASETVISLARRIDGIRFDVRGTERLKGLDDPVKVVEVVSETPLPKAPVTRSATLRRLRRKHATRRTLGVGVLVAVVAAAGAVLGFALLGEAGGTNAAGPTSVLQVLEASPADDPLSAQFSEGLVRAATSFGLETETVVVNQRPVLDVVARRIERGEFDLVLWFGAVTAQALLAELDVASEPDTHFVFFDGLIEDLRLDGVENATALFLDAEPAAQLAGYLGALMEEREETRARGGVSVVGGARIPPVQSLVDGFRVGARDARPDIFVQWDYSGDFEDQALCERIANEQIDEGSSVVFAAAGKCGNGALAAAGLRGTWGVGVDHDQSYLGPHMLASVVKRFDKAVELAVRRYLDGTLPGGVTVDLGLADDAVGLVGVNAAVPPGIRDQVAREAARIRQEEASESAG